MIAPDAAAGVAWFPGLGFRPAVLTPPHRADQVDPARIVPAPDADVAYSGKFDPFGHLPAAGYAWGTWIPGAGPASEPASPGAMLVSAPLNPGAPFTAGPLIPGPWPSDPEWPCCVIREPDTPLPPVAPVPLPASAGLLIAAVAAFAIIRRRA